MNHDGIDDFFVEDTFLYCHVVYGNANGLPVEISLTSLLPENGADGSEGVVLYGNTTSCMIKPGADVNGDGLEDYLMADRRRVVLLYGKPNGFGAQFDLPNLFAANGGDGSEGRVFNAEEDFDGVGEIFAMADIDSDGFTDVIIGAPGADLPGLLLDTRDVGRIYVLFGSAEPHAAEFELASLHPENGGNGTVGFVINGIAEEDYAGSTVETLDFNGDGIDDVAISANNANPGGLLGGRSDAGQVYVVFGRTGGFPAEYELSDLLAANGGDGSQGVAINGGNQDDHLGVSMHRAGDMNGDGIDDLAMGIVEYYDQIAEHVYVVFGSDTGFPAEFEVSTLHQINGGDGSKGFRLSYYDWLWPNFAGDLNADGADDMIISYVGDTSAGHQYLFYGSTSGFPAEQNFSLLLSGDGSQGFIINGIDPNDASQGSPDAFAGDVNGDGVDDLILGAAGADHSNDSCCSEGEAYVLYGRVDIDGDQIYDAIDNCPTVDNPHQTDSDADSVGEACDNCLAIGNPTQCDYDNDGYGNHCDADFNQNLVVNFVDLAQLKQNFLSDDLVTDLNCNGVVNFSDLAILKSQWLDPPGPSALAP